MTTVNKMGLTKLHARKVLEVVRHGLVKGVGVAEPGKMCVEAAVCYALGLPHGDDPKCVAPAVRAFKIALNDAEWPSEKDRAEGMSALAIAQLGSDGIDEQVFAKELARLTIMRIVPLALREAAAPHPDESHKKTLLEAAKLCENEGTESAAESAAWSARYARYAARSAESAAWSAWSAARSAESAAESAESAAAEARLKVLRIAADIGIEALKVAGAIGCEWLDIVNH